jgi:hypothetical protein
MGEGYKHGGVGPYAKALLVDLHYGRLTNGEPADADRHPFLHVGRIVNKHFCKLFVVGIHGIIPYSRCTY